MEPGAKVKLRGVQVGRVASIQPDDPVKLQLELVSRPAQVHPGQRRRQDHRHHRLRRQVRRPAHSRRSRARKRLAAGAVLGSDNVSTEVNTVFQNLVGVLNQIDIAKLNAVLLRAGRRLARQGRSASAGHHRCQPGAAGDQPAQRDDPGRLPRAQRASATPTAAAAREHRDRAGRREHDERHDHQQRQALDSLLLNVSRAVPQRHQPARPEQGQPGARHQRARAHHPPADEVQPGTHLHCWSAARTSSTSASWTSPAATTESR